MSVLLRPDQGCRTRPNRRGFLGGGLALTISVTAASAAQGGPLVWPNGSGGAVTITYDDGLDSQLDLAVPALDARGLKATFFVTMDNIEHRLAEWAALPVKGHELADHTMSHPCDLQRYTPEGFVRRQLTPMENWLDEVEPERADPVYAYPCDVTDLGAGSPNKQAHRYARLLRRIGIVAARTSEGEPNNPARLRQRAYRLQALAVGYDAPDVAAVMRYLALAERRGDWAILIFHGLSTGVAKEGDVSQAMHAGVLDAVTASRLWTAPIGTVLSYRHDKLFRGGKMGKVG